MSYIVCKLIYWNDEYSWYRVSDYLTRHQLIKYVNRKIVLNDIVSIWDIDTILKTIDITYRSIYCILKEYKIANIESIKNDVYRYRWKHKKKKLYIKGYPVPNLRKRVRNNGRGCITMGIKRFCSINSDPIYKEFYDPTYRKERLRCFDWEPVPRYYKRDRCWKKQYKVKKQYMIHM